MDANRAEDDALSRICAETLTELERRRAATPIAALKAKIAASREKPRGFGLALKDALMRGECGLIAEIKRRSPSGGEIRQGLDIGEVARAYQQGGAVCLSVLTEGPNFGGGIEDLRAARAAVPLPVLRKDFMLDPWQIYESRAAGADAVLLIMAALTDQQALELEAVARELDLDVLAEVHNRRELNRALGLQTPLIGINNRDLKTLKTDIDVCVMLAPHVSPGCIVIAESGIQTHADVARLAQAGAHCLLVGESLLRQADIATATKTLLGTCP